MLRLFLAAVMLSVISCNAARAEIRRDVEYGKAGDVSLKADINVPDGAGPFPMAILVHGGGWSIGDKAGLYHIPTEALTKANFVWLSINYRMAPKYLWPDCYEDVKTAIRFAKAHAADFKGDPARLALIGYSAGGQLVCLAAVQADESTRVQAVVGMAPPTDLELDLPQRGGLSTSLQHLLNKPKEITPESRKLLRSMSAINFVKPGLPPFLLMQGDKDKSVPYQGSMNFQAKLRANNVACDFITLHGAPHNIGTWEKFDPQFSQQIVDWLNVQLASGATRP
jgi:alpha-L-fucosidase 2